MQALASNFSRIGFSPLKLIMKQTLSVIVVFKVRFRVTNFLILYLKRESVVTFTTKSIIGDFFFNLKESQVHHK